MPMWTLFGLQRGKASTGWPLRDGEDGQAGTLGFPRLRPERCVEGCNDCAAACLPGAISVRPDAQQSARVALDYGRCVVCQVCVETCPQGAFETSSDWAFGVRDRAVEHGALRTASRSTTLLSVRRPHPSAHLFRRRRAGRLASGCSKIRQADVAARG